jgi:hypothetical protein
MADTDEWPEMRLYTASAALLSPIRIKPAAASARPVREPAMTRDAPTSPTAPPTMRPTTPMSNWMRDNPSGQIATRPKKTVLTTPMARGLGLMPFHQGTLSSSG